MVVPLIPPHVAPADLWYLSFTGWDHPAAHQRVSLQVVGCAPCFSTVDLSTTTGMIQLPFFYLPEELKAWKARLHMLLRDSLDDVLEDSRGHRDMVFTESTWLSRKREGPLVLAKSKSLHVWTGREPRSPGSCHDLWWRPCNLSPCHPYFAPPTTSFPHQLTTSSEA